jgi:hypothetical protein
MQARANEICSADFIADALWSGRRFRTFNVIDNCNREVLKTRSTRACRQRASCALRAAASLRDPRLEEFRWHLEELRVSLFAQELRTPYPVSYKRLEKIWNGIKT